MDKVDKSSSECWLWKAHRLPTGYGQIRIGAVAKLAHRVSHELFIGPVPDGMDVCHRCDNPPCVNPSHLFAGTVSDNMRDGMSRMRAIGRHDPRRAKLTEQAVSEMREAYRKGGVTMKELGQKYGITAAHVCRVIHNQVW